MKKTISILTSLTLMFTLILNLASPQFITLATQTKTGNFSKSYTLTGNNADDIVAVAKAQLKKTGSDLGYSEQWCADFVNDCAKLANISSSVIPHEYSSRGACIYMYNYMINNCGAAVVSTPRKGDLVFFDWAGNKSVSNLHHVAIVTGYSNKTISIIGGNQGSSDSLYTRAVSTTSYSIDSSSVAKIVRPKYNAEPSGSVVPSNRYYPACSSSCTSLVDALKSIGEESSYDYRATIAAANGVSPYSGTAAQNTQLLNLLKAGMLVNPYYSDNTPNPGTQSGQYYPACSASYTSIVEALKSIGVDSSYSFREKIAARNNIAGYGGTAEQNTQMLNLLKAGKLIDPNYTAPTTTKATTVTTKTTTTTTKTTAKPTTTTTKATTTTAKPTTTTTKTTTTTAKPTTTTTKATTTASISATTVTTTSSEPQIPVILPKELTLQIGDTAELIVLNCDNPENIVWISSNKNVADIENGIVFGVSSGEATIYAVVNNVYCEVIVTVEEASEEPTVNMSGDLDSDGVISANDLIILKQILLNEPMERSLSDAEIKAADLNENGVIDVFDLVCMRQLFANQ